MLPYRTLVNGTQESKAFRFLILAIIFQVVEVKLRGTELFVLALLFLHCSLHLVHQWFLTGGTRTTWGYEEPMQGVRSTKVFRDTRSENLNQILLNIHRDSL